ncbi:hypothetical protein [Paenibacillus sp. Z6-24]
MMLVNLLLTYLSRSNRSIYLLKETASRDYLTGLHNPRAFEAIFEQKVPYAIRTEEPFSLIDLQRNCWIRQIRRCIVPRMKDAIGYVQPGCETGE